MKGIYYFLRHLRASRIRKDTVLCGINERKSKETLRFESMTLQILSHMNFVNLGQVPGATPPKR